ncbi:MAG: RIP metalloprotease RseP [Kiritimatiellales bacterium]|nr:RIP metalloprotease RseP [Kiritimatiellales bacterium]
MLEILYIVVMMLFLFGVTIFVHEWGHFIAARKCGLVIEAFSIGMGPALWKKEIDGIVYKIGAFPIGGYVSLPQLDPEGMEKVQGDNNEADRKTLPDVSPWKKIVVAVAGPLCNIVFAFILALIVSAADQPESLALIGTVEEDSAAYEKGLRPADQIIAVNGNPVKTWYDAQVEALLVGGDFEVTLTVLSGSKTHDIQIQANNPEDGDFLLDGISEAIPCVLGRVTPGSPAEAAGIQPDDIVKIFNSIPVIDWNHFTELVQTAPDQTVTMTVMRNDELVDLTVTPKYDESMDRTLIGVKLGGSMSMPWTLTGSPIEQIKSDSSSIFRLLKALTTKGEAKQAAGGLGGPVAIFTMIWFALKMGIINALGLIRFININLAVLNLLPLPVLDGGHICFALWEGVTRRKVHPKVVATLVNVFAILLISAMVFLSWRDADRNWNISRFFKKAPAAEQPVAEPAE